MEGRLDGAMAGVADGSQRLQCVGRRERLPAPPEVTNCRRHLDGGAKSISFQRRPHACSSRFGTYQWQVDGPIDTFDKNVVLGLFPYGPAAGIGQDGTNEIDIEYAVWGHPDGPNGDWTDYPASGSTIGEKSYTFSLGGGTLSTSRFIWKSDSIQDFLMPGLVQAGSTTGLINSWTYSPADPTTDIPQVALPLATEPLRLLRRLRLPTVKTSRSSFRRLPVHSGQLQHRRRRERELRCQRRRQRQRRRRERVGRWR